MSHVDMLFYTWLAAQPAFVEVGVGVAFVVLLAPAELAVVAQSLARLEQWTVLFWQKQQPHAPMRVHSMPDAYPIPILSLNGRERIALRSNGRAGLIPD